MLPRAAARARRRVATWRGTRTCSVRSPRSSSHAASGASTPPIVRRVQTSRSRSSASRVVTTPASTSEWPARYLVALCQARSAPRSSGRCRSGVANVLSQHRSAPPACASRAAAAMSVSVSSGLDGVSTIASAAPSQARRKPLAVARVVAPHLDAEALEDPGREALEAVVAARRQRQGRALAEDAQADARPGRHAAREDRRLGVLERAEQRLGLGRDGRVPAPVRRARRPARARTSSSGRARARARATGCRRGRGRAASRAPWPEAFQLRRQRRRAAAARPGMPPRRHHCRRRLGLERGVVRESRSATSRRIVATSQVAAQVVGAALDRDPRWRGVSSPRVGDHAFEVAVAPQQLGRGLLADAAGARDVVGGVAAQRDQRRHLLGLDAVALAHAGAVDGLEHARAAAGAASPSRPRRAGRCRGRPRRRARRRRAPPPARPRSRAGRRPRTGAPWPPRSRTPRSCSASRSSCSQRSSANGSRCPWYAGSSSWRYDGARASRQTSTARGCRRAPGREQHVREADEQADGPAAGALDRGHRVVGAVPERVSVDHEQRRHAIDRNDRSPYPPFSALR